MDKVFTVEVFLDREKEECFCELRHPGEEEARPPTLNERRFAFALVESCGPGGVEVQTACSGNHQEPVDFDLGVTLFKSCPHLLGVLEMLEGTEPRPGEAKGLLDRLLILMEDYSAPKPS